MTEPSKAALCLTGGGVTGALYQVGALAALEDAVDTLSFELFIGASSGAALCACLAGGLGIRRLYRALIDPADNFFPLERGHIVRLDIGEWRRTLGSAASALRHGFASLVARTPAPAPSDLWEQLDRFYDALPAGLFALDRYEQFLSDLFLRRGVSNSFRALPKPLLVKANDVDSGELVWFGTPGFDHVPISLACAASMALPLFFSPVRVGERYYFDGGMGRVGDVDVAAARGAAAVVLVNPNVPIRAPASAEGVPTGHGSASSIRDKGLMWVFNQAVRTGVHARGHEAVDRARLVGEVDVLLIEPDAADAVRFLHNAASFAARRDILEWAYHSTAKGLEPWLRDREPLLRELGWIADRSSDDGTGRAAGGEQRRQEAARRDPMIAKAVGVLDTLSADPEVQRMAAEREEAFLMHRFELGEAFREGEARGRAEALLALLQARGLEVPGDVRDRIQACTDLATLDRWIGRALTAQSAAQVVGEG